MSSPSQTVHSPVFSKNKINLTVVVKVVFLLVAWAIWAVIGTAIWFGLAFRALAVFSGVFLYSMFTHQSSPAIGAQVNDICDFWFRGFRSAHASLFGPLQSSTIEERNAWLALEIVWAAIFWYGFLFFWKPNLAVPAFGKLGAEFSSLFVGLAPLQMTGLFGLAGFLAGLLVMILCAAAFKWWSR